MSKNLETTYEEKLIQANREAKATVIGLILTIIVWLLAGFGLAGVDVQIFSTPLWIITGCVGTWLFAIAVAVFLAKRVFTDVDLDDEEGN